MTRGKHGQFEQGSYGAGKFHEWHVNFSAPMARKGKGVMALTLACLPLDAAIAAAVDRVFAEYREMPGLSLTQAQMERLFGFDASVCKRTIDVLVKSRLLRRTPSGRYISD